eukprot:1143696-Pelagomonas_calceolata.AAC.4
MPTNRNALQDLGLGTRWVAHDANVDVATQGYALARVLVHPTKQHQQHCLLDGVVAPHAGHHAARQLQVHLSACVKHSQISSPPTPPLPARKVLETNKFSTRARKPQHSTPWQSIPT